MKRHSNIYLKPKKAGGMKITFQSPPKNLDEKMLYNILRDYKMLNCEVLVRDENGKCIGIPTLHCLYFAATVDDFIDVIMKDHRKYIKWCILPVVIQQLALTCIKVYMCTTRSIRSRLTFSTSWPENPIRW